MFQGERTPEAVSRVIDKILANYHEDYKRTAMTDRVSKRGGVTKDRVYGARERWFIRESWKARVAQEIAYAVKYREKVLWDTDCFIRDMVKLARVSKEFVQGCIDRELRAGNITVPHKPIKQKGLF
jgi:hypothetical protein